jgi:hypothetical protein
MALQPFVGPWQLFQSPNPIHSQLEHLDGELAHLKAASYTQNNTNTEKTHTDIHALSGIRTHYPSVRASEESSCLRRRGHCHRPRTFLNPVQNGFICFSLKINCIHKLKYWSSIKLILT